ncbi:MAG: hypothetical protein EBQ96_07190 [Proteobacteria bacterium]|nr:hypothetical protein [Pseudomonadota bacterium]
MKPSVLRRFFHISLVLVAVLGFGLAGCSEFKTAEENVKSTSDEADRALQALEPKSAIAQPLMIDKSPYYGSQARPIKNGANLPAQFESNGSIVMTFARPVSLPEFTRMVQAVTGIRAAAPNISAGSAPAEDSATSSGDSGSTTFIPSDGEQVSGGRVVWQGKLSDLLNQASDVFGAEWIYNGESIQFAQQVTRTFMLHALATELSVKGTVKSGSGDSGSNLPEVDVTSTSSMKVWEEIKGAVDTITNGNGTAAYSPSTGTITVTGSPEIVRRVESYLNQQNALRLRRVAVAVRVLSVTTRDALTLTANLRNVIERAFDTASVRSIGNVTSGLAIGVLKAPESLPASGIPADGSVTKEIEEDRLSSELSALKIVERVSIAHSGALVTLSDQPAPLQVGRQTTYLARVSSTSGDGGSGSTSLEPGTVNTGLLMTVLPRIVEQNKILMRLSIAITELQSLETASSGGVEIQTPEISTTGFLQNAVLTSGETMVLAGFEKNDNMSNENGSPGSWALGGTKEGNRSREVSIMMITAEILPEDPITVIGQ